ETGRPRARHVPEGGHVGRRTREARGAGALRGDRRVQDGGAGALSLMPRLRDTAALVLGVRRFWGPVQCSDAPRPPRFRCPQAPSASVSALALGLLLLVPTGGRAEDLLVEAVEADAAIEERVRAVLVHRLAGDSAALSADVDDLAERDRVRHDAGLPPTGLTDDVRYLAARLAVTRDTPRDAPADVLAHHPDPVVRRLAEHERDADDAAAADRLLAD